MTVWASKRSAEPRSSVAMSTQPSTGGWRAYHPKRARPEATPVATNTLARMAWRSSTGSAWSATSR